MSSIAGRHTLITGGSSGIGLATATALAEKGARVTIVARRPEPLDAAVVELGAVGADVSAYELDVSDRDAVGVSFAKIADERGTVDILVCSAGVARPGYFEELPDEVFREMIDIDYFGTLWPIREVVPAMIEQRSGSIVGISSDVGLIGVFGYTAYAAAKFAVRGLLESLHGELAPHGIHVGCCYPPDTDTPQLAWENEFKPAETRAISATFKAIQPEQVAACIVKGIERERFALMPDFGSRMLAVGAGLTPRVITSVLDRSVRKTQRDRGSNRPVSQVPESDVPVSQAPESRRREHTSTLGATTPLGVADATALPVTRPSKRKIIGRVLFLLVSAFALYGLLPQLLDVWAEIPKLRNLNPVWFIATLLLELGSFVCQWMLTRTALPQVSWFVAGTSQLVSNAVSKTVPGGAAMGAATGYRMLSVSGVNRGTAGAALAGTAIVSNGVLFALPMVAVIGSILSAPVPSDLALIAWGGALLFLMLFAVVFTLVRFDRPLWAVGRTVERVTRWVYSKIHRPGGPTAAGMVHQRDAMVDALGSRWEMALAAAVGNWGLDYLALVAALYAVGAKPRLSLVLLAYGAAAVLSMIPITPGGLGFVEAGLTATLIAAGVNGSDALLATLAYRVVSYWLPLPAGLGASFLFRRRYGRVDMEVPAPPLSGA